MSTVVVTSGLDLIECVCPSTGDAGRVIVPPVAVTVTYRSVSASSLSAAYDVDLPTLVTSPNVEKVGGLGVPGVPLVMQT